MGIAVTSGLALLFFVLFFCQCRKSREGTLFYTHHNNDITIFWLYHQTLAIFFICEMNVSSYGFSFLIEFCFYTLLTKRKPWSLQYNTRNDRIFRCSAPREASCSCTRGQWRNQLIPVSNRWDWLTLTLKIGPECDKNTHSIRQTHTLCMERM